MELNGKEKEFRSSCVGKAWSEGEAKQADSGEALRSRPHGCGGALEGQEDDQR
jgi:hypothetical protein